MARADQLVADGQIIDAIAKLSDANRRQSDPAIERTLVRLRHAAWPEVDRTGPGPGWEVTEPDHFPAVSGMPEVSAAELDGSAMRSAIQHHGGLIVRGLLSRQWCARLREGIDRSWEAIERYRKTKELDPTWFDPMDTDEYGLTIASRAWVMASGTSYVPDSPRLLFDLLEAFDDAGVKRVVTEYFWEPPALSLVKLAQRRLAPDASGRWHQDAAVYGANARTLNFWVPVSRCGDVAPGLEMWPRRLDRLVKTVGKEGVAEFTALDEDVATLTAEVPPVRPVFEEGDAAVFDQFLLHQTAASSDFREKRYGFECWFFAPSTYPEPKRWIPMVY